MYVLWSVRSAGWYTLGHYSSDLSQAQQMPRDEALAMVARHRQDGQHQMLPVRLEDLA